MSYYKLISINDIPFPVLITIAGVIIVLIIVVNIILNKWKLKSINETLEMISKENNFIIQDAKDARYNKIIETDATAFYIKYVFIPKNSSITVNSQTTWCLRFGGGNRKGRNYPNKEYMNYMKPFLSAQFKNEKKVQKLVILYPSTEVVLKYLNESDIAVVKFNETAHGVKFINYVDLQNKFVELTK